MVTPTLPEVTYSLRNNRMVFCVYMQALGTYIIIIIIVTIIFIILLCLLFMYCRKGEDIKERMLRKGSNHREFLRQTGYRLTTHKVIKFFSYIFTYHVAI